MMKILRNEKGIALVTVLVLSLIALAIISTLVYLVIQGTRFSGFFKRYETAREAAYGGGEIVAALIKNRGQLSITGLTLSSSSTGSGGFLSCNCGDPDVAGDNTPDTCLCRKLCDPTSDWVSAGCDNTFDPTNNPDIQFDLPADPLNPLSSPIYQVSAKIVDTTKGYTDLSGEDLGGTCVACSDPTLKGPPAPYLYRIEINAQDQDPTKTERGRLSILYAY